MTQPRSSEQKSDHVRVVHQQRDTGSHQNGRRLRFENQWFVQASVEIDAGGHFRLITGQPPVMQSLIEYFKFDFVGGQTMDPS